MVIADMNVEDSFDIQGYFVGKLPFDLDTIGRYLEKKKKIGLFNIEL